MFAKQLRKTYRELSWAVHIGLLTLLVGVPVLIASFSMSIGVRWRDLLILWAIMIFLLITKFIMNSISLSKHALRLEEELRELYDMQSKSEE